MTLLSIHYRKSTTGVPETTATTTSAKASTPYVIVAVNCGESGSVVHYQHVSNAACKPADLQPVVVGLAVDDECRVFHRVVSARVSLLQLHSQLAACIPGQIVQSVVAEPEFAVAATETRLELVPRTVKEVVVSVDVPLYEDRCVTHKTRIARLNCNIFPHVTCQRRAIN